MTSFREYENGDAWITADENNERNSARGTYVRQNGGGVITIAASSSEPLLSITDTEFRVAETDYSLPGDTEPLPANATAYPRRDLVIARKPPDGNSAPEYDVLPGDPISPDLLQRLQNSNQPGGARVDDEGLPIHSPESIPQVQPPDATGLRDEATVLAMVYVPPGTADSTDLADEYITDLRREGIGVEGVLRTGDAVAEVEDHPNALAADITGTAGNADNLGGVSASEYRVVETPKAVVLGGAGGGLGRDNRVSFPSTPLRDNFGFLSGRMEVSAFGNYQANDDPVLIVIDFAAIRSANGTEAPHNVVTQVNAQNAVAAVTASGDISVYFDTTVPLPNWENIDGALTATGRHD